MRDPKETGHPALAIAHGDILQLNPHTVRNPMFAACMLVVTELKAWGVQGYVQALGSDGKPGGQAYYRAQWSEVEIVGRACWVVSRDGADDE